MTKLIKNSFNRKQKTDSEILSTTDNLKDINETVNIVLISLYMEI